MAYEYDTKAVLLDLMKQGSNRSCFECDVPSPQWCSLSYGTYLCLTCSGVHRSLGVHLSFVRSLTMDKWTPAQIKRMEAGGNAKCREWFEASPEYHKGMSMPEKYNTHFAAQYRDKLLASAEGRPWKPEDTPAPNPTSSSSTSSASSTLRKPRVTGARAASPGISHLDAGRSVSPSASLGYNSPAPGSSSASTPPTQKEQNESYFTRLGSANASRPAHLPPSQGGKYAGFGSGGTSSAPSSSSGGNPSEGLSSRALPSFEDITQDPVSAVSKGWGLFSAALGQVGRTVNDSVLQPTLSHAVDPSLQSSLSSYLSKASTLALSSAQTGSQILSTGLQSGGQILKRELGVDAGDLGASYVDRVAGRGAGAGYSRVGTGEEDVARGGDDDFWGSQLGGRGGEGSSGGSTPQLGGGGVSTYRDGDDGLPPRETHQQPQSFAQNQEDSWAKLAPQSTSRGGSGRTSPSVAAARGKPAPKPVQKKKDDDDWDSW